MVEQGRASTNSSHEEKNKKEKDDNHRKTVESSPSTNSFNDEAQKSGGENGIDDGNDNLTPSTSENDNNKVSNVSKQVPIITTEERLQVKHNSQEKREELESTKAEIGEVMEENQRLKQYLNQITKDYQLLQKKLRDISEQDSKQIKNVETTIPPLQVLSRYDDDDEEADLVSLSLGRSSSLDSKKSNIKPSIDTTTTNSPSKRKNVDEEAKERSLDLGLECKFKASSMVDHPQTLIPSSSTPDNSFDETKDGGGETWSPSKVLNKNSTSGDDEVVQQPPMKKARVSVRVRCDTPTMNDGCQWRKYGQKISKGNPCPRAYYRCTVAPSCPVRKQVQRCAEDMSILITTYEGTHNHPLPVSASAMASTTSAAAYMLLSKSSTSSNPGSHPSTSTMTTPIETNGLNFNILDNSNPKPIYNFPNPSSYSTTPTHPTITLDLTSTNLPSTNQFNRVASNFTPRNLTFNFSDNNYNTTNSSLFNWSNGLPSYGTQSYMNKTQNSPLNIGSSRLPTSYQTNHNYSPNHDLPDTIAQAAKVLTSDPSFQSILTATLTSFISGNNGNVNSGNVGSNTNAYEGEGNVNSRRFMENIKWGGLNTSSSANSAFQSSSKETN